MVGAHELESVVVLDKAWAWAWELERQLLAVVDNTAEIEVVDNTADKNIVADNIAVDSIDAGDSMDAAVAHDSSWRCDGVDFHMYIFALVDIELYNNTNDLDSSPLQFLILKEIFIKRLKQQKEQNLLSSF